VRLLLIDDHPLVAYGMKVLLADRNGWELRHTMTVAGSEAMFDEFAPDVAIIDVNLPDGSGLELLANLKSKHEKAKFIILTLEDEPMTAARALNAGALAFVSKSDPPSAVLEAIETVQQGGIWLPHRLLQEVAHLRSRDPDAQLGLSNRELEILRSLAHGQSMSELAFQLDLSYKTISKDVANLRERLGAKSLPELVRIGMNRKLIA
jgi:two-component system, NarL family, invasion response regulator UvrY